ncbi:MAG: type II toxin-antitoxin system VapC family toxin [Deltaproteobacteria bacterium]|nr:MAG: type II toxin-antitoxin system VapC family toxin [Deltaproteobacteria bacterium]
MKILLDTCTFLWIITDDPELSERARSLFRDPSNDVYLSSVSVWEMMVKHSLGRLPLPEPPEGFIPAERERHGIEPLPLEEGAVLYLSRLPRFHNDPFDRMLICQAINHGMTILTPDKLIVQYPVATIW